MRWIDAWLFVEKNHLPDYIESMLFTGNGSAKTEWCLVTLPDSDHKSRCNSKSLTSTESALVHFELPACMRCWSLEQPDQATTLSSVSELGSEHTSQGSRRVWLQGIPAMFAKNLFFGDEHSVREFESTRKRLLAGRGNWLSTGVIQVQESIAPEACERDVVSPTNVCSGYVLDRYEKLAATAATAVSVARTALSNSVTVTFDTGTVALLRQLVSRQTAVPDEKTRVSDARTLMSILVQSAQELNMKRVVAKRRRFPDNGMIGLQIAHILREVVAAGNEDLEIDNSNLFGGPAKPSKDQPSADQAAIRGVARGLINLRGLPTAQSIVQVLEGVSKQLEHSPTENADENRKVLNALRVVMENVQNSEHRIDKLQDKLLDLPGVLGIAQVFWSWSDNPLPVIRARLAKLKDTSKEACNVARVVYAAAGGAGRLSPRNLEDGLWIAAYRTCLAMLVSDPEHYSCSPGNTMDWATGNSKLEFRGSSWLVRASVGREEIPLSLVVDDLLQVVENRTTRLLDSIESKRKVADAILDVLDGDTSLLPRALRSLVKKALTVRVGRDVRGEITEAGVTFRDLSEQDCSFSNLRWSDWEAAVDKLRSGRSLAGILKGFGKRQLEELRERLDALTQELQ